MTQVLIFVLGIVLALPALAQGTVATAESLPEAAVEVSDGVAVEAPEVEAPVLEILNAAEVSLADFQWLKRPLVVFADTPADPRFKEQLDLLLARPGELIARDVVVLTDSDPKARSEVRLNLRPRGFQLTVLAKDGTVNLRKPFPWDVREISRTIDKMPLRQEEIRAAKASAAE